MDRLLIAVATGAKVAALAAPSARDNSLAQSIAYLKNSSGLYSIFYKVYAVWGKDGERTLLKHLIKIYNEEYKREAALNQDIIFWLNKHSEELKYQRLEDSIYIPFSRNKF